MGIKLDLHKAYDSLDWGSHEYTLKGFGFSSKLNNLIMFYLKESNISVIWNGEKLALFKPGRGLR